jgi:hypothetical protein
MKRHFAAILTLAAATGFAAAQSKSLPLSTSAGLTLHNATATPVTFQGKKAIRVTVSEQALAAAREAAARAGAPKKKGPAAGEAARIDVLSLVDGVSFSNGVIEVDLAGEPAPGAEGGARGFAGIAWRVQEDRRTYDAFYLRPTNGRADDQERRNHTVQYISHPAWPWFRLREETPSRYESYADIEPAKWIHVKIEVAGEKARLYVNGVSQPTLLVNDVKSGANGKGGVALWIEGSTVAHFANLKITPAP